MGECEGPSGPLTFLVELPHHGRRLERPAQRRMLEPLTHALDDVSGRCVGARRLMVAMGLVFPPVGMIAFVVSATAEVGLVKVYTGTSILMSALVLTTILIMAFPEIVLWLPNTMK